MRRSRVVIHNAQEIAGIRKASQATAWVLDQLCRLIQPAMTTLDVDRLAAQFITQTGGESAFHGYRSFPGTVCISVNDEVVHGIGSPTRTLMAGDLVSIDVGVRLNGFIGDTARTICVGGCPSDADLRLLHATQEGLEAGIAAARVGNHVNDISRSVQSIVQGAGFSVVRDFVGHGCGCELHEPPEVPNFAQARRGPALQPGMVLAIEPMVNTGSHRVVVAQDGWTVHTADGGMSAHFEHMVLVKKGKPEILTWPKTALE